jgi:hypothetical protein
MGMAAARSLLEWEKLVINCSGVKAAFPELKGRFYLYKRLKRAGITLDPEKRRNYPE